MLCRRLWPRFVIALLMGGAWWKVYELRIEYMYICVRFVCGCVVPLALNGLF